MLEEYFHCDYCNNTVFCSKFSSIGVFTIIDQAGWNIKWYDKEQLKIVPKNNFKYKPQIKKDYKDKIVVLMCDNCILYDPSKKT